MALYVREEPVKGFNLIRWHRVTEPEGEPSTYDGYQPCSDFQPHCCGEFYALPALPGDYIAFVINKNLEAGTGVSPDNFALGYLNCCEFSEAIDGMLYQHLSSYSYFRGNFTVGDFPLGSTFNLCIYNILNGAVLFVSNPFRIISEEEALCSTLILQANMNAGFDHYFGASDTEYYPIAFNTETRIDARLVQNAPFVSNSEYRTTDGILHRRNEVQVPQYRLETSFLDDRAHEALALYTAFTTFDLYTHGYQRAYTLVRSGAYSLNDPPSNSFCLRTANCEFQMTRQIASFRTC